MNSMHYMTPAKCNVVVSDDECSTGTEGDCNDITTIMLKNIPSRCRRSALVEAIDGLGFKGSYDFLHHPMKRNKCQNYGYAVINFKEPIVAKRFLEQFDGYQLKESSGKRLTVSQAAVQGLAKNKMRFGLDSEDIVDSSEDGGDFREEEELLPPPVPVSEFQLQQAQQAQLKSMSPAYITLSGYPGFVDTQHPANTMLFRPPPGLELPQVDVHRQRGAVQQTSVNQRFTL
eukprot:TRINITY_DN5077_c0_g3_i1.p2 TRINITY_DN5077_c0_g3~~TRINITY_DN5077_c0_g3_i1.p2  ORF type:complete len:230 (-),score=74.59 TRINITY_DN5077_c0_g3_i1:124-813(-)